MSINSAATFVSLYSGAGGLDLGLVAAGMKPVFANDINADAVATHNFTMKRLADRINHLDTGEVAVAGDIRSIANLPAAAEADLVVGGPPCQGFSVAGHMDPNDPRSRHVWDFMAVVRRVQPRGFVMENVKALAVNRRWSELRKDLINSATALGYRVELVLLNASHFGVPQARERMFLVGLRDHDLLGLVPTTEAAPPTLRSALASLPPWGEPGNDSVCTARVTPAKSPVLRKSAYAGMLFNGQGRPMNLDAPAPTLPASMGGNRTPIIDQLQLERGDSGWILDYHAHLMKGGEPLTSVPDRLRRITVEEGAAIQTFPTSTEWVGSQSSRYRQIGNAVPPRLGYAIGCAVRDSLGLPAEHDSEALVLHLPHTTVVAPA
jgi:DNA (cytosine-5)-methyltransferase 1